ncbi:MAG: addiction module toxin RelE [Lactobacillus sp.]|jgi:mRNA interferase RelE/StbE|nr:addiction module toxin RelE [Lactobacillus sp.]
MIKKEASNYQLVYFKKARQEYDNLDGSQLVFVDKGLDRIAALGMTAGQPLRGELAGCNKLKNRKMGLRIVFTQEDKKVKIIQIVAIGKRSREQVYRDAVLRLIAHRKNA